MYKNSTEIYSSRPDKRERYKNLPKPDNFPPKTSDAEPNNQIDCNHNKAELPPFALRDEARAVMSKRSQPRKARRLNLVARHCRDRLYKARLHFSAFNRLQSSNRHSFEQV